MKEMIYKEKLKINQYKVEFNQHEEKQELLYQGTYKAYNFYIKNMYGDYPTAYIEIPKKSKLYGLFYGDYAESIDVHGGITYSKRHLYIGDDIELKDSWFIGWDYAHAGDYISFLPFKGGKKWTTEEILEDVIKVCKKLKKYEV